LQNRTPDRNRKHYQQTENAIIRAERLTHFRNSFMTDPQLQKTDGPFGCLIGARELDEEQRKMIEEMTKEDYQTILEEVAAV
jgi:hypothetical protein